jgi:hypothetical protein
MEPNGNRKKLWTSYYGGAKQIPEDILQVQISRGAPGWWYAKRKAMCWELAPNDHVWDASKEDPLEWRRRYRMQLEGLLECGKLGDIIGGLEEGCVLLCWCKESDCHRKELAAFLNARQMAYVEEYPVSGPIYHSTRARKPVEPSRETSGVRVVSGRAIRRPSF